MNFPLLFILSTFPILTHGEADNRLITTLKHSKFYVEPTIINGIPVRKGQMSYVVSIKEPLVKVSNLKYIWTNICGGSILSKTKVLTAAHCFEAKDFYFYKHPEILRLVAGNFTTELIHTTRTDTTKKSQWRAIRKVILHSKFNFPDYDIALIFVDQPWVFGQNVGFVRHARRRTDYLADCVAAGFGSITLRDDEISPVLLVGHMFLLSRRNCSKMYEMNMDNFICTYSFMSDVGRGDSGGPLACQGTLDPAEKRGQPLLVGVVSGKNFDRTSLYTRVSQYRKWIDNNGNGAGGMKLSLLIVHFVVINHVLSALWLVFMVYLCIRTT